MQHKATIFYEWEQGKSAYSFPFPYLSKQFVKVRVDHANTSTLLEYNRDYTIEGQTLTLTPVQPFVTGATLCIYRQTPTGSLVDFSDGSLLLASEMDRLSTQLLHVEEENSDLIASTGMFADDDNSWQGQGRRIKNLSDPVDTHDAVTLSHLDKVGVARREEIAALAVRAESAAETANKHAAAASVSKDDAQTAKQGAETARDAAKGYAEDAKSSAEKAKKSADDSMAVVENIQTRETNVLRAETDVKSTAQRVDQQVQWISGKETAINGYANTASEAATAAAKSAQTAKEAVAYEGIVGEKQLENGAVSWDKLNDSNKTILSKLINNTGLFFRGTGTPIDVLDKEHPKNKKLLVGDTAAYSLVYAKAQQMAFADFIHVVLITQDGLMRTAITLQPWMIFPPLTFYTTWVGEYAHPLPKGEILSVIGNKGTITISVALKEFLITDITAYKYS